MNQDYVEWLVKRRDPVYAWPDCHGSALPDRIDSGHDPCLGASGAAGGRSCYLLYLSGAEC